MDEMRDDGMEDRRPTPVRAAMESSDTEEVKEGGLLRSFKDPKTGQEWVAKVSGRSNSGVLPLRVIPLMELTFSPAASPNDPEGRAICQGESLDELDDEGLLTLLNAASPLESEGGGAPEGKVRQRRDRGPRGPRRQG